MSSRPIRPDYDQALRRLFADDPAAVVALVAPQMRWLAERSSALPAIDRRADIVWEVEFPDGARGLLHIELQIKAEGDIGQRLCEYSLRLYIRDGVPVYSIVIFLRPTPTPEPVFVIRCMGQERHRFVFDIVRLWELPPESILDTAQYTLWPLTGLMANVSVESVVATAGRLAAAPLDRHERSELTGLLALLAGMRLPTGILVDALERDNMIEDILKESSFFDAVKIMVRKELLAEGRAEGEAEGMREMARVALESRFAPLDDETLAALAIATPDVCRDVVAHIATDTREQARARLGLAA